MAVSGMFDIDLRGGVARLTLNRPPANAINREWVREFHAVLDDLGGRDDWSVLHIASALTIFSAGADIKEMRTVFEGGKDVSSLVEAVPEYQGLFSRIEALPQITLAEIGGAAMGGGFELALACDLRIVADEAMVGLPEVRIGLLPGAGGTQRLTRLCGRATALRIINGIEMVDGRTAVQLGMAQWHAPLSQLSDRAAEIARRFADQPARASRLAKECINMAASGDPAEGYKLEYVHSKALLESAEAGKLIKSFLARKQS